jgi:hypothetical protein
LSQWTVFDTVLTAAPGYTGQQSLNAGTYYLAWQIDTAVLAASYTAGVQDDGASMPLPFGAFATSWTTNIATSNDWSIYGSYFVGSIITVNDSLALTDTPFVQYGSLDDLKLTDNISITMQLLRAENEIIFGQFHFPNMQEIDLSKTLTMDTETIPYRAPGLRTLTTIPGKSAVIMGYNDFTTIPSARYFIELVRRIVNNAQPLVAQIQDDILPYLAIMTDPQFSFNVQYWRDPGPYRVIWQFTLLETAT